MHAAPAVSVRSSGDGLWRLFGVLMPAVAGSTLGAWALAHAQLPVWPALFLIPMTSLPLWRLVKPQPFEFRWDGQRWLALGTGTLDEEGSVDVMLDLGPWLLVRWRPVAAGHRRRWVSLSAAQALPDLHALRAAVYCRRPEPTPGTRSAPLGRPTAEPD